MIGTCFIKPEHMKQLVRDFMLTRLPPEAVPGVEGLQIVEMEDQERDAWFVSDPILAAAYAHGHVSEDYLKNASSTR